MRGKYYLTQVVLHNTAITPAVRGKLGVTPKFLKASTIIPAMRGKSGPCLGAIFSKR